MINYKLIKNSANEICAISCSTGWQFPPDPANTDFQEYLKWVDDGNEPLEADPLPDNSDALRAAAYISESDPLFFKAQRGEATMDQWLAKVQEIKNRYPPKL